MCKIETSVTVGKQPCAFLFLLNVCKCGFVKIQVVLKTHNGNNWILMPCHSTNKLSSSVHQERVNLLPSAEQLATPEDLLPAVHLSCVSPTGAITNQSQYTVQSPQSSHLSKYYMSLQLLNIPEIIKKSCTLYEQRKCNRKLCAVNRKNVSSIAEMLQPKQCQLTVELI
jgi:hypothetical protein